MPTPTSSEDQLVQDLQAKCPTAFSKLYDTYSPALFGIILRLVKEQTLAEDLLHDAFIKIWANMASFKPDRGRLFTWLATLARNVAVDALRARRHQLKVDIYLDVDEPITSSLWAPEALQEMALLGQLAPIHRQVIELVYYCDYTHQEIADELKLPLGTVKTRVRTGLHKLKKFFSQDIYHYHLEKPIWV